MSQNTVNVIYEDYFGLVWIGTNDGLNRFEGEKLEIYNSNSEKKYSLIGDRILDIEQDNKFRLWLVTAGNGLSYYDYKTNHFKKANIKYKENQNLIVSFTIDTTENTIWAATDGAGIFSYNYVTQRKIEFNKSNTREMSSDIMSTISIMDDRVFVGTSDGQMIIINPKSNSTKVYQVDNSSLQKIKKYGDKFLIGTTDHGFFLFDIFTQNRSKLAYNEQNEVIRKYGVVNDIYQVSDSSYILTFSNGISYLDIENDTMYLRRSINRTNTDIAYDFFNCVTVDSKGTEWFGSNGFGLYYNNEFFSSFKTIPNNKSKYGLSFSSVRSIEIFDEKLWIGGYGGINTFDHKTKEVTVIESNEYNDDKNIWTDDLYSNSVYCFYQDPNFEDLLLIGTEGNGMHQYSKSKKKFKSIRFGKNYGNEEEINSIFQIEKFGKNLLLGTSSGLYAYEPITETHSRLSKINSYFNREVLLIKSIFQVDGIVYMTIEGLGVFRYFLNESKMEDISKFFPNISKGIFNNTNKIMPYKDKLLLGTKESGLFILDIKSGKFKSYNSSNGLINDCVYEILDDLHNNLWVSTNRGLSKINLNNESITNYNSAIFNLNSEFNSNAALKVNMELFYFGGTDGLVYFNPKSFNPREYDSNLIIKTLELNNNTEIFNYYFVENDTIRIDYLDDLIRIEFTTNEYLFERGLIYSCRINNLNWEKVKNNKIKISGLSDGLNTIEVKIYDENGKISEIKKFFILVNRPFWESTLFLPIVFILLLVFIYKVYINKTKRVRAKLKLLSRKVNSSRIKYLNILQKFNLLDTNITNVVWETDKDFNITNYSTNLLEYYNLNGSTQNLSLLDLYTTADIKELKEEIDKLKFFRKKIERKLFHKNPFKTINEYSDVIITITVDNKGEFDGLVGVVVDNKEHQKAKLQIIEREELFSTLVSTILEPVLITNWSGEILFANNEAKNVLEITQSDITEKNLFDYLDDPLSNELRKDCYLVKNGEVFEKKQFELIVNNKQKTIEGNGTQLTYFGKTVFLLTFRDVTQKIKLIKELTIAKIEAERSSELKTMYLSNLTHELKTPINAISGFTDIIISKNKDSTHKNYLKSIKLSTNLLLQLINDLLFYTKAETGRLELRPVPTNIKTLFSEIENIFNLELKRKNLKLIKIINTNGIEHLLNIDQLKFKQILINLMNNSIKYTESGKITVSIILSSVSKSQVDLELTIEDTGKGIPKSRMKEIFSAFKQVNISDENVGFGLGLAIVKRILDTMNGTIIVESELDKGSKFTVQIKNINLVINKAIKSEDSINIKNKLIERLITRDNKLSIYSYEILDEMQLMLNGRFTSKLKNINTNFLLKDISEFAEQLYIVANEKGIDFIKYYAEELKNAAKAIEVEKINYLLENFYKLVELINRLMEKRNGN